MPEIQVLLAALYFYGAFGWLTLLLSITVREPRFAERFLVSHARALGVRPRTVFVAAVIGCSVLWPLTTLLLIADLLRRPK
ncbi:hypothetical protein [Streptosporangium sp. NPDC051022]|uniref:hypothetical protein n=1 Tax=Streptosporangium sp. NPDC051022 TaxID=3155752 RepID=UPI00342D0EAD